MRHLRKIGHALRMALVAALHLLQKHQVCRHTAHGLAQLVQHEATVEGGEAFVHIHGEHLECNRQGGWVAMGEQIVVNKPRADPRYGRGQGANDC